MKWLNKNWLLLFVGTMKSLNWRESKNQINVTKGFVQKGLFSQKSQIYSTFDLYKCLKAEKYLIIVSHLKFETAKDLGWKVYLPSNKAKNGSIFQTVLPCVGTDIIVFTATTIFHISRVVSKC